LNGSEHFIVDESGPFLLNSKYNVCFPHDKSNEHEKYKRRLQRLKDIILDKSNFICFVYVSVSSKNEGNYTVNGQEPIQDINRYMLEIEKILQSVRKNYKIIIYDTNKDKSIIENENIEMYSINQSNHWTGLLPELVEKFNIRKSNLNMKE